MTSINNEDGDTVLSDVEEEEDTNDQITTDYTNITQEDITLERFLEVVTELENEKKSRLTAENSLSDLENRYNRMRTLTYEAIRTRDEAKRKREEESKEKEEVIKVRDELREELDAAVKAKDESEKKAEEMVKERDMMKSEIDAATQMLVSGIEKISKKISGFKNFSSAGGLPKSQRYDGLPGVAFGVIKRTHEIVEELVKQHGEMMKSRNEAREHVDQRNYEIAIEVSQLEATIGGLREEVAKKVLDVENLEKLNADKDGEISELDRELLELKNVSEKEMSEMRDRVDEYDRKLKSLESKVESQRPVLIDQMNFISKIHDQIHSISKIVDAQQADHSDYTDSLFIPSQEMDVTENLQASLDLIKSTSEIANVAAERVWEKMQEWIEEKKGLNETVERLMKEKQHIGSLLKSALPRKMTFDPSSKTSEVLQAAENGLRDMGIETRFNDFFGNGKGIDSQGKNGSEQAEEDEVYTLAGALENIVKACQLEIIDLKHSVDELRTESSLLKVHVEAQSKELSQRRHRIEELEEKERVANESVEGLMMDIAAAEEEIIRWKVAAEQEAAAGRAVEQEFISKLSALQEELNEAKQNVLESEKKLKFKEETAAAAMAARDAAVKSLGLADSRASRLRERVEELSRQLDELDTRGDPSNPNRQRYACWPWQWLGLNFVGNPQADMQQQASHEMELSEPFL